LAAASPVFKAMFKEGTKEHRDNYVNIEDINSDVFEVFLGFPLLRSSGQIGGNGLGSSCNSRQVRRSAFEGNLRSTPGQEHFRGQRSRHLGPGPSPFHRLDTNPWHRNI
jgi:hypothetical protein